ncbi:transcriptional antiterminator [Enterococcus sp. JM4C]|uniref:PRD domain-containing protein n=1 Tax=Candidatus Enterococcus huntleyi TaxID=1857217 RepID=UPI00137AC8F9|nr:PRD domain-containing protein [Enterococcus sp. JM4C]KAF1299219.1 transcriptional antiterminator [Enterococcus sp. JM4C]
MKIKKILNNNAVLVGKDGKDFIWIGTGLGFKMKPGQEADEDKIEKVFVLHQKSSERLVQLLQNIPIKYASLADDIIKFAKKKLPYQLSDAIYISLTDHLYNLVKLKQEGISINNRLSWEIKKFYPMEYTIGTYAVSLIEEKTSIELDEAEISNIAMHIINAQINDDVDQMEDIKLLTKKIKDIISIIRIHNKIEIDESSLAFERFVTHLRFFFRRIEANHPKNEVGNPLLVHVIERYPEAYETTHLIEEYLKVTLFDDEQLYLTLHVQKLIEK